LRFYAQPRDWLWFAYSRLLMRRFPLPGRGRICGIRLRREAKRFYLRLGTSDWNVIEEIFQSGEYGPITSHVCDPRLILDLGANVGISVRLWQKLYPSTTIVAVEPDARNLAMLKRNALPATGVITMLACVAGAPGTVYLDRSGGEWGFRKQEQPCGEPVRAVTIQQILEEHALTGDIDLLKCDIEGAEEEVFAHCAAWIHRVRSMVVELHPPYTQERFLAHLAAAGSSLRPCEVIEKGGMCVICMIRP